MIGLARSERMKRTMQRLAGATPLAQRFVGGDSAESAIVTARWLKDSLGISSSLFHLGEYVDDPAFIGRNVDATIGAIELLGAQGLDVNVSIDPTAIGHLVGEDLFQRNAERIANTVAAQAAPGVPGTNHVMLDMEDLPLVDATIRLHRDLLERGLPAAVTLQARLRRTEQDLGSLVEQRTAVRLVKGAFPLGPEHGYQGRRSIDRSYLALAEVMLSPTAREAGFYPIFATHDDVLARQIIDRARRN